GHEVAGLVVDAGLRWALLRRLCATGRADDGRIAAELVRDPTDAGRRHAMSCRAAIPDAAHKQAAWALLTQTDELGVQGVSEVAQGFALPEHASLLGAYTERYFEVLPGLWASRGEHFRNTLALALFPAVNPGPALLDRVDEFLAAADRGPGLARVLTDRRATVELALRSRDLPA
ncbi:MAG TPA: ERAP1-like C-terminal domain-containing protein, partial [Streptosporangiaceae bacterium]